MTAWVLRATVLGALVVALRVLLGLAMGSWPTYGIFWRALCLAAVIAVVVVWGLRDARAGADSLTVRWLAAGFGAGLASSAVCWVLDQVPGIELGDAGLLYELTSAASFILLLIFLPAMVGVAFGHIRSRRSSESATPATEPAFATAS
ncbi:B-4DMT family transporter [Nocardia salmonicida]|uniref:B-4DMT family transporter n=1 Tax=Nocardia salmonicida TaxID=53431 RepID=UPI0007C7D1F1|nr:B-4DMT family transporter [Nocardia salmonicida]